MNMRTDIYIKQSNQYELIDHTNPLDNNINANLYHHVITLTTQTPTNNHNSYNTKEASNTLDDIISVDETEEGGGESARVSYECSQL